jgi:hypothetical protein
MRSQTDDPNADLVHVPHTIGILCIHAATMSRASSQVRCVMTSWRRIGWRYALELAQSAPKKVHVKRTVASRTKQVAEDHQLWIPDVHPAGYQP